jgi:hypothetical protein
MRGFAAALVLAILAACSSSAPSATAPTATPSATSEPTIDFGAATRLSGGTHLAFQTQAGVTYYSINFKPALTIRPGAGWWVENNINTLTSFERGPHEPSGPPEYLVQLVSPTEVVPASSTASLMPAPADLLAWLRARPDLTLSAPKAVTVAGIQGSMIEGGLRVGAAVNPEGLVNLICGELSECGYEGGQLIGAAPGRLIEFIALDVRGDHVIIALIGPEAHPTTDQATFEAFLTTLAFPTP